MSKRQQQYRSDPRFAQAVAELKARIADSYPGTAFDVQPGIDDPHETWLIATVDVDDPDEIIDLVIDRLLELQIEERLPLHVLPVHTPERIARARHHHAAPTNERSASPLPLP